MQIVGICRFSYLATRGWKRNVQGNNKATAATLYTKERMDERFNLFETVCLPSMTTQTDQDFKFMILTSNWMPEDQRTRLADLVAPYPNIVIQEVRPRTMTDAVSVGLRRTIDPEADGPVVQFCLDDDDALSVNYIARLRSAVAGVMGSPFGEKLPIAFNNPRGITLSKKDGKFSADENFAPFLALGLAIITSTALETNAYMVPHLKTATRMFAFSDPKPMTYLRGLHDHHDSHGISKGRVRSLTEERLNEILAEEFPFMTPDTVDAVFRQEEVA